MPIRTARPYAAKAIIEHEFDTDHLNVFITFRFTMDQAVKPANALWICEVDDVEKAVTVSAWQDAWTMLLTVPAVVVPPDRVTLEYDGPDENLRITWDKQWEPWGPILSTDIGKAPVFVDRGDPAAYDYAKEDLTIDGAWHDMDLSTIVSENAKAVFIIGHLQGAGVDWHIIFRKKGNVNEIAHGGMETLRANVERHRSSVVALDANRIIQYKVDDEAWDTLDLAVKGWWFEICSAFMFLTPF
ncbi:hypothetical protein ES705_36001 [subsurface metagenome]